MIAPLPCVEGLVEQVPAVGAEAGVEIGGAGAREPERLLVVAGVALEGLVDEAPERGAREAWGRRAAGCARPGPDAHGRGDRRGDRARGRLRRRPGGAGRGRSRAAALYGGVTTSTTGAGAGRPGPSGGWCAAADARRARWGGRPAAPSSGWPAGVGRATLACFQTFTNRCPAVMSGEDEHHPQHADEDRVEQQADAEEDDALGPLHEAAAGVEAERLGLGPLVGDQHRGREDRHRAGPRCARDWWWRGTRRRRPGAARR